MTTDDDLEVEMRAEGEAGSANAPDPLPGA
jgi:hypothetical protein